MFTTDLVPPMRAGIDMYPLSTKYSRKKVVLAFCEAAPLDILAMARFKTLLNLNAAFLRDDRDHMFINFALLSGR